MVSPVDRRQALLNKMQRKSDFFHLCRDGFSPENHVEREMKNKFGALKNTAEDLNASLQQRQEASQVALKSLMNEFESKEASNKKLLEPSLKQAKHLTEVTDELRRVQDLLQNSLTANKDHLKDLSENNIRLTTYLHELKDAAKKKLPPTSTQRAIYQIGQPICQNIGIPKK